MGLHHTKKLLPSKGNSSTKQKGHLLNGRKYLQMIYVIMGWGGLTNSCEKKRSEKQRGKERYKHLKAEFQRLARRDKKAFISDQCKEIEENNRIGKKEGKVTENVLWRAMYVWHHKK